MGGQEKKWGKDIPKTFLLASLAKLVVRPLSKCDLHGWDDEKKYTPMWGGVKKNCALRAQIFYLTRIFSDTPHIQENRKNSDTEITRKIALLFLQFDILRTNHPIRFSRILARTVLWVQMHESSHVS